MAAYTAIDDPTVYFRIKLYSGNNNAQNIAWDETDTSMEPALLWIKSRAGNTVFSHVLGDDVRGGGIYSHPDTTAVEVSNANVINTFNSNGFSVGGATFVSEGSRTYVAWGWKAGTTFSNDASATSVGSIDSSGQTSSDSGFSIVSYTGTGSAGTIAHNLGAVPTVIIQKNRDAVQPWWTYHSAIGAGGQLRLNGTDAEGTDGGVIWNSTAPTSTVFSVGDNDGVNGDDDNCIAYCFVEKQGFSKFGSYVGNGDADGPFIYMGFKPAMVIYKRTDSTANWSIFDNKRDPFNEIDAQLNPNIADAEGTSLRGDFVSNGWKIRATAGSTNADGGTYIYMAFAEAPFVNSNGVPCNAR